MKFGKVRINASVMIALLAALYILMVCREKYFIEYAEGEPAPKEVVVEEGGEVVKTAETAPVVTGEAVATPKEEGMSAGAIAGITAASIVALIATIIMFMRLRK